MKTYGVDIRKFSPFEKKGKNYHTKGFTASEMKVMEQTSGKPKLVTPEYIEHLINKYKLKEAQIKDDIKELKKMRMLIRKYENKLR